MDKNTQAALDDLKRRIEALQTRRDIIIKKEKERKARAQEKWQENFWKTWSKELAVVYGEDYEETADPEKMAHLVAACLKDKYQEEEEKERDTADTVPDRQEGGDSS